MIKIIDRNGNYLVEEDIHIDVHGFDIISNSGIKISLSREYKNININDIVLYFQKNEVYVYNLNKIIGNEIYIKSPLNFFDMEIYHNKSGSTLQGIYKDNFTNNPIDGFNYPIFEFNFFHSLTEETIYEKGTYNCKELLEEYILSKDTKLFFILENGKIKMYLIPNEELKINTEILDFFEFPQVKSIKNVCTVVIEEENGLEEIVGQTITNYYLKRNGEITTDVNDPLIYTRLNSIVKYYKYKSGSEIPEFIEDVKKELIDPSIYTCTFIINKEQKHIEFNRFIVGNKVKLYIDDEVTSTITSVMIYENHVECVIGIQRLDLLKIIERK